MAQYLLTTTSAQESALQSEMARENVFIATINADRAARRARGEPNVEPDRAPWTALSYVQDHLNGPLNRLVGVIRAKDASDIAAAVSAADATKLSQVRAVLGLEAK